MKTSDFLSVNARDWAKGLAMAVGAAVFAMVADSVTKGQFTFDFTTIWHTAVAAGVVYMGKNFLTPGKIQTPA